jgi:hypothetical protein
MDEERGVGSGKNGEVQVALGIRSEFGSEFEAEPGLVTA